MEQIVETSGVAKTTIYRHFPTKDDLVVAFLEREDSEFWAQWDVVVRGETDPANRIAALCRWVGERVTRPRYRGCPQINVAAEFSDEAHPARRLGRRHKTEMYARLVTLASEAGDATGCIGTQIALMFDGAFVSGGQLVGLDAGRLLTDATKRLLEPPAP